MTKKILKISIFLLFSTNAASQETLPNANFFSNLPAGFAILPDQPNGTVWLPPSRPFQSIPTDPRDLKIAFRAIDTGGVEGDIGGYRSVLGWKGNFFAKPTLMHWGIEGTAYFSMQKEGSRFPLESSDGLFGLYWDINQGPWFYQMRFTHISAHLSDGVFDKRTAIRYSREYLVLRAARQISWFRPYIGYQYLVHTIPANLGKHAIQFGFYAISPWHWKIFHPYFGFDQRINGKDQGKSFNASLGIAINSDLGAPPIRLVMNYFKGNDLRGQFFQEKIEKVTYGFELDF